MPSEAIDDYLKIIFALTREGGAATTGEIARRLAIAPASVTGMVQRLAAQDPPLVEYSKNRGVGLSAAGRRRALEVIRHHRLLETFLHETLGVSSERVHAEAEKLEHYISEDLEDTIAEHLGNPDLDPHGAPIPQKDGTIPGPERISLVDLPPGGSATIVRIPAKDPGMRRYLLDLGLERGRTVRLESIEPFGGPVYVLVGGERRGIGRSVARELLVIPDDGMDGGGTKARAPS
jgi:DtxR family Mn-dependent transcriptional regulator